MHYEWNSGMEYGISASGWKKDSRSSRSSQSAILIQDLYIRVQGHKLYSRHEDSEGRNREEVSHITVFWGIAAKGLATQKKILLGASLQGRRLWVKIDPWNAQLSLGICDLWSNYLQNAHQYGRFNPFSRNRGVRAHVIEKNSSPTLPTFMTLSWTLDNIISYLFPA